MKADKILYKEKENIPKTTALPRRESSDKSRNFTLLEMLYFRHSVRIGLSAFFFAPDIFSS